MSVNIYLKTESQNQIWGYVYPSIRPFPGHQPEITLKIFSYYNDLFEIAVLIKSNNNFSDCINTYTESIR
jgi:hypothetical protein